MEALFGIKGQLDIAQECARAVLIFFYGLAMLRISGRRTFAHWSALDLIVSFIVGSSMARALAGDAPLAGTLAAVAVLVGLHVLLGYAVAWSPGLSRFVEGSPLAIIKDGVLDQAVRLRNMISMNDLDEALRKNGVGGMAELHKVRLLNLEPNGNLTVLKSNQA